jgi:hypothetical protein
MELFHPSPVFVRPVPENRNIHPRAKASIEAGTGHVKEKFDAIKDSASGV